MTDPAWYLTPLFGLAALSNFSPTIERWCNTVFTVAFVAIVVATVIHVCWAMWGPPNIARVEDPESVPELEALR